MHNLIKYEFRKSRTAILVLAGILAAIEALFLGLLYLHRDPQISVIAIVLLSLFAQGTVVYVFISGIVDYSRDLRTRSGWMVFMTPNSSRKILASKYLFMFALSLLLCAVIAGAGLLDLKLYSLKNPEFVTMVRDLFNSAKLIGIQTGYIAPLAVFVAVGMVLSLVSTIAVAWFAVTLSRTLLRDKGWRWIVSLALFIALMAGIWWLTSRIPSPFEKLQLIDYGNGAQLFNPQTSEQVNPSIVMRELILPSLLRGFAISLFVILASWLGCSALLERKIDL